MSSIQKYTFKKGLPQEFEVVDLGKIFEEIEDDLTQPHRLDFYQILWFKSGRKTHMIDFEVMSIEPNTLVFIGKNSVQMFSNEPGLVALNIIFTDTFFATTSEDLHWLRSTILYNDLLQLPTLKATESPEIIAFYERFQAELARAKDSFQDELLRLQLKTLLVISERQRRSEGFVEITESTSLHFVTQFKALIEEQFERHKQVAFYCDALGITPKRLNHATQKVIGINPKAMIDERVLLEAKRLLSYAPDSVKEIAYQLGFEEPTNFIKYFRKHAELTPLQFRKQFKME